MTPPTAQLAQATQEGVVPVTNTDAEDVPETARRTSLGCGNQVAVADLNTGETVLDLGSDGGMTC